MFLKSCLESIRSLKMEVPGNLLLCAVQCCKTAVDMIKTVQTRKLKKKTGHLNLWFPAFQATIENALALQTMVSLLKSNPLSANRSIAYVQKWHRVLAVYPCRPCRREKALFLPPTWPGYKTWKWLQFVNLTAWHSLYTGSSSCHEKVYIKVAPALQKIRIITYYL